MPAEHEATSRGVVDLLAEARRLAVEYYQLTGRPLGITGEVAEYEAARILGLDLAIARMAGYDAIEHTPDGEKRVQVKGRRLNDLKANGGRLGKIDLTKSFDSVMLVMLDAGYQPVAIYEATYEAVQERLTRPGSKSRNERGQMTVSQFRAIAEQRWPPPDAALS